MGSRLDEIERRDHWDLWMEYVVVGAFATLMTFFIGMVVV